MKNVKFLLALLMLCFVGACTIKKPSISSVETLRSPSVELATSTPIPTNRPRPDYLVGVGPMGEIGLSEYNASKDAIANRGIFIAVEGETSSEGERIDWITNQNLSLFIDGKLITNDTLQQRVGGMEFGPYYLSWSPNLTPGLHEIQFQIITAKGKTLEYSWYLLITEP